MMNPNRRGFLSVVSATVAVLVGSARSRASGSKRWMGLDLAKEGSDRTVYGRVAPRLEFRNGLATNLDEVMGPWRPFDPIPENDLHDLKIESDWRSLCLREGYPILEYERRTAWVYISKKDALMAPNPWDNRPLFLYGYVQIGETGSGYNVSHMTCEQISAYFDRIAQCQGGSASSCRYNFQILDSTQATITPYREDISLV